MSGRAAVPVTWWRHRQLLVAVVAANALLAGTLVVLDVHVALRPFAVFGLLVAGPGLAVTGWLRLNDAGTELALAVPLSLALDALVAGTMSGLGGWRPTVALIASAGLTVVLLAGQLLAARRGDRRSAESDQESAAGD